MQKTLAELAEIVKGEVIGDQTVVISSLNGIKEAQAGELTFLANAKYLSLAQSTQASAIVVGLDVDIPQKNLIRVDNPSWAFSQFIQFFIAQESFQFEVCIRQRIWIHLRVWATMFPLALMPLWNQML